MQKAVIGENKEYWEGAVQQEKEGGMGGEARNKQGLMCLYYFNLWSRVQCKQHRSTDHHFNHSQINACTVSAVAIRHFITFEPIKGK